jgi:hypothetical protein
MPAAPAFVALQVRHQPQRPWRELGPMVTNVKAARQQSRVAMYPCQHQVLASVALHAAEGRLTAAVALRLGLCWKP